MSCPSPSRLARKIEGQNAALDRRFERFREPAAALACWESGDAE
jgi:hypothetical protein